MYCTYTGLLDLAEGLGMYCTHTGLLDLADGLEDVLYLHRRPCRRAVEMYYIHRPARPCSWAGEMYCTYTGLLDLADGLGRRAGDGHTPEVCRPVTVGCLNPG